MFGSNYSAQLLQALYETLYMVSIALFLGAVIGIPLRCLIGNYSKTRHMAEYSDTSSFKSYNQYFKVTTIYYFVNCDCTIHKISSRYFNWVTAAIVPLKISTMWTRHCKTC